MAAIRVLFKIADTARAASSPASLALRVWPHSRVTYPQRQSHFCFSATSHNNSVDNDVASSQVPGASSKNMPETTGSALDGAGKEDKDPLYLPAPEEGATAVLDVSTGATVKLDHLGPLVVGKDGSLARIGNWDSMADIERANTLRILCKRNKQRLEALRGVAPDTD